jgi:hypothetical protein
MKAHSNLFPESIVRVVLERGVMRKVMLTVVEGAGRPAPTYVVICEDLNECVEGPKR